MRSAPWDDTPGSRRRYRRKERRKARISPDCNLSEHEAPEWHEDECDCWYWDDWAWTKQDYEQMDKILAHHEPLCVSLAKIAA